jgi:hypothetical protein
LQFLTTATYLHDGRRTNKISFGQLHLHQGGSDGILKYAGTCWKFCLRKENLIAKFVKDLVFS